MSALPAASASSICFVSANRWKGWVDAVVGEGGRSGGRGMEVRWRWRCICRSRRCHVHNKTKIQRIDRIAGTAGGKNPSFTHSTPVARHQPGCRIRRQPRCQTAIAVLNLSAHDECAAWEAGMNASSMVMYGLPSGPLSLIEAERWSVGRAALRQRRRPCRRRPCQWHGQRKCFSPLPRHTH